MIVAPSTPEQWRQLATILQYHTGVHPSADLKLMGWLTDGLIKLVVGFNGFIGKVCQMHLTMTNDMHFSPREMLEACFKFAFEDMGCEMVLGVVSSANLAAMKYDTALGFKELYRIPGMHVDGADLVLLGLRKEECRYLDHVSRRPKEPADVHPTLS